MSTIVKVSRRDSIKTGMAVGGGLILGFSLHPVDPAYNHTQYGLQMTGGSTSTWSEWERLRQAGATARMMLIAAAAQAWNVDPASCRAENGFIVHAPSRRQLSYGELAERAAHLTPPQNAPLKDAKDIKLIGKPIKRLDTPEKINGTTAG